MRKIDLTGKRFGRLTVVSFAHKDNNRELHWKCVCDCGNIKTFFGSNLRHGRTQSCGCLQREIRIKIHLKHGHAVGPKLTSEYRTWVGMKTRCTNAKEKCYKNYGGRGIRVCKKWAKSFKAFFKDMGKKPSPKHSIERINCNGNYEPSNCRWATMDEQAINRRDTVRVKIKGKLDILINHSKNFSSGVSIRLARERLGRGWPADKVFLIPPRKSHNGHYGRYINHRL